MTVISGTGHRPQKLGNEWDGIGPCSDWIRLELKKVFEKQKPDIIVSGMALGYDMLLAEVAIEMSVPLTAAVPFIGQESAWTSKSQERFFRILEKAKRIVVVSEGEYSPEKMQIRNEWMVNNSDKLVACWNKTPGGTGNCVKYAKSVNKEIIYLPIWDFKVS